MGTTSRALKTGWRIARTGPGRCPDAASTAALDWRPAAVGAGGGLTAAASFGDDGRDYDAEDYWFAVRLDEGQPAPGEKVVLKLGGLATQAEVYIDGALRLRSESMFAAHQLELPDGGEDLLICCRALAPLLRARRRPRARWRTKLTPASLRFHRTMLLGRSAGFAPGPAVVGPWRPVEIERRSGPFLHAFELRPRLESGAGCLTARGRLGTVADARLPATLTLTVGASEREIAIAPDGSFHEEHRFDGVRPWWPHTHGEPVLSPVSLRLPDPEEEPLRSTRIGFRRLQGSADLVSEGLGLRINDVPVFCRGAVWTPPSLEDPDPGEDVLRPLLTALVEAGGNMLRVPGTACWESDAFHDLCDELGILVWQDCMFANHDYPASDPGFMAAVETEVETELGRLAGRPSLAVVCGGSEVAQQVAMVGLDPSLAEGPLYGELLPELLRRTDVDAVYIPSAPWGGALPFRPGAGVANYFGVGAYLRPLEDARRAGVLFASECLAVANVPDGPPPGDGAVLGRDWKVAVPRDAGAGWDFDDVRDHYLALLWGVDPAQLRYVDPHRYLALSREVSGEMMAETFGEWRRSGSGCSGALVLWLKDLIPGAGWGLLDATGEPKVALHHLRRVWMPLSIWITDEGLGGYAIHVANDGPVAFSGEVRVALYRDGGTRVEEASSPVTLGPHGAATVDAENVLGHFADVNWSHRFGPPAGNVFVASLQDASGALRSQAFRYPAGRPGTVHAVSDLGLRVAARRTDGREAVARIGSERLVAGVRLEIPGWRPCDDAFAIEPGREREIRLLARGVGEEEPRLAGRVSALNLRGSVPITVVDR